MPKLALLFALALPLAASGQGVVTVAPQQCVWHAGDNPAWAATSLDESNWQPYTQFPLIPDQPRYWIRCHLAPDLFAGLTHPALEVRRLAAWELFLDGE